MRINELVIEFCKLLLHGLSLWIRNTGIFKKNPPKAPAYIKVPRCVSKGWQVKPRRQALQGCNPTCSPVFSYEGLIFCIQEVPFELEFGILLIKIRLKTKADFIAFTLILYG